MSKKLMLLAAGALTALAFTALPSAASASEWENHCTSLPCTFTIQSTGHTVFSTTPEDGDTHTVTCATTSGSGSQTALTSKSASVELTFTGCKELDTFFQFSCNSPGQPGGTVTTNMMTADNIYIDAAKTKPGVRLTGINTTFSCAGGISQTRVTGAIIGTLESGQCNVTKKNTTIEFVDAGIHGHMETNTVTGVTAPGTDMEADPNEDGDYVTSAQRGTAHLNWNQNVTPTC